MSVLLLDNLKVTFDPGLFYQNNVILNFILVAWCPPFLFLTYSHSSLGLKQISGILSV